MSIVSLFLLIYFTKLSIFIFLTPLYEMLKFCYVATLIRLAFNFWLNAKLFCWKSQHKNWNEINLIL